MVFLDRVRCSRLVMLAKSFLRTAMIEWNKHIERPHDISHNVGYYKEKRCTCTEALKHE